MNTVTIMDMMFNAEMIARGFIGGKADMTEKRFECDKGSRIIIDNETKLHYIMTLDWECSLVTKLLNRFAEENEQLKHKVNCLQDQLDDYVMVEKENEQLKSKLTDCKEAVGSWSKSYNRVYGENEQLKYRIKKLQNELNNCEEDYILEEYL